jgi:hypothetical protein
VSFGVFKQKKGTVVLELPRRLQAYQITKVIHALELTMISGNHRTFRRAGLVANLQVLPPVAWVLEGELLAQIERSRLRDSPQ